MNNIPIPKMAKAVSPAEFNDWLLDNVGKTWYLGAGGGFDGRDLNEEHGPYIKYIYGSLDTRTMQYFSITVEGISKIEVDFREEFDGTILDLLDHKLNDYRQHSSEDSDCSIVNEWHKKEASKNVKKDGEFYGSIYPAL